jgi:transposase
LAFLTEFPTPQSAAHLGTAEMGAFCKRHSYRGGKDPAALLTRRRAAPTTPVGLPAATLTVLVFTQVQLLHTIRTGIDDIERCIKQRLAAHPKAKLLAALPGVGMINLAQIIAEIGPVLDRVDNAEQAAAECGAAPVTRASGKTRGVYFRWAANTRARKAITAFAHNSRMQSPWAGRLYTDARARGKRNPHATRIVARAWLRVIWACWHNATAYDPERHTAANKT